MAQCMVPWKNTGKTFSPGQEERVQGSIPRLMISKPEVGVNQRKGDGLGVGRWDVGQHGWSER